MDNKLRAVIYIDHGKDIHADLKRLALFFDEIQVIYPEWFILKEEVLNDPKRVVSENEGKKVLNFFRDTYLGLEGTAGNFKGQLKETFLAFKENGVIKEPDVYQEDDQFKEFRSILAAIDVQDKAFNKISHSTPDELKIMDVTIGFEGEESEKLNLLWVIPPRSIQDSYILTKTLHLSYQTSSFPIFLNNRHREEMRYRYLQYKKGLELLKEHSSSLISPTEFKASFGEVTFNVANSLFTSDLIATKTPEQIIKYRNEMADVRQKFISKDLMEIASMIQDNPWDKQTKEAIEKYIAGKLTQDILLFNDSSRETWEKMFGNLAVHLTQVTKSTIIGSSTGGLLGNLIPNTSAWHMLLVGALVGATSEAPNLVRSIVDTILEHKKEQRSSIAYIARFRKH
jgi:hypothetical protein